MLYALLIFEAEGAPNDAELAKVLQAHRALQKRTKEANAFVEANQLMPAETATTVRVQAGQTTVMDGPYAETKELIIGLYVLECASLEQAIEYARSIPHGTVEIRPVAYLESAHKDERVWQSPQPH